MIGGGNESNAGNKIGRKKDWVNLEIRGEIKIGNFESEQTFIV